MWVEICLLRDHHFKEKISKIVGLSWTPTGLSWTAEISPKMSRKQFFFAYKTESWAFLCNCNFPNMKYLIRIWFYIQTKNERICLKIILKKYVLTRRYRFHLKNVIYCDSSICDGIQWWIPSVPILSTTSGLNKQRKSCVRAKLSVQLSPKPFCQIFNMKITFS